MNPFTLSFSVLVVTALINMYLIQMIFVKFWAFLLTLTYPVFSAVRRLFGSSKPVTAAPVMNPMASARDFEMRQDDNGRQYLDLTDEFLREHGITVMRDQINVVQELLRPDRDSDDDYKDMRKAMTYLVKVLRRSPPNVKVFLYARDVTPPGAEDREDEAQFNADKIQEILSNICLLYTSPSPRD